MDIKSNLQILSEAAGYDAVVDTRKNLELDYVKEEYSKIPECSAITVTEAADVIITPVEGDGYYVEMVNLAPFMLDSGIKSISKAIDIVAEANYIPSKQLGLIIESQDYVNETLNKANNVGYRARNNAIAKVNKNTAIVKRLMAEGYKVARKAKGSKVCPDCGKAKCECSTTKKKSVIAEKDNCCK